MSNQFIVTEPTFQNTEFKWTHSANWLLINSYVAMKDEFRDPKIRKKELWIRISDKFREVGYEIGFEQLDKKFRNLKSTYYQVKERKQTNSNKQIRWEYYKVFDELIKGDEIAAASGNTSTTSTDPRLTNFRSSVYVPERKRKRLIKSNKPKSSNETIKLVSIEPAGDDMDNFDEDSSEPGRKTNYYELQMNDAVMEDSQDDQFEDEYEFNSNNGKKVDLSNLEARKLHAETRYFNKKADYFEKQTMCLDIQRKLMIMQAHKLKLEIDQMKNDAN
ncbi:uncharacterized protein LOC129914667 isoform X2 [Episyrphus balteatus]|uniref:uncharacterized protein LOC129914667 isoform X2 n=1 Tax=Episyrphus balteatus TaxID=286459 RepID=UPI002485C36F|nr:uncharacterized protein LOC129914667 isoform X2 [Episyrphus balteatus]